MTPAREIAVRYATSSWVDACERDIQAAIDAAMWGGLTAPERRRIYMMIMGDAHQRTTWAHQRYEQDQADELHAEAAQLRALAARVVAGLEEPT